jgi:lipoprotein NlpI
MWQAFLFICCSLLAAQGDSVESLIRKGSQEFRGGQITNSILSFERGIKLRPDVKPHLWQLGIAYYYAGRFAEGRDLFQQHQTVNSEDVENAVWHFLCVARIEGADAARKKLIPISRDARVPMKQIHELFSGKSSKKEVLKAAAGSEDALFYAHLYLGLYEEALGRGDESLAHIKKAANDYRQPHYMGDVARVHLSLRSQAVR